MPRGPQTKYVRDDTGKEVHGLCQEKVTSNGVTFYRYYSWIEDSGKRRKKHHGTSQDKVRGIFAFRQWEASRAKDTISFGEPNRFVFDDQPVTDIAVLQELLQADELIAIRMGNQVTLPAELVWKKLGELIMKDPRLAAQRMGVPELSRLHTLPPPAAPLSLTEISDSYLAHKLFKYPRQKTDARTAWNQFVKAVDAGTIEQITTAGLARYYREIMSKGYAPRTVKNLIRTIQGFLNHAYEVQKPHRPQIQELKQDIRSICKIPKQKEPSPQPMDQDDYLKLLELVEHDPRWHAMLLTALNLALHGTELAEVRTAEINLKRGEFSTNRTKTGVVRVAKLWDRTVTAIRRYMETEHFRKNPTKLLFTNKVQRPYTIDHIDLKMQRLRKKAEFCGTVVFDGIRDLFRRAAGAKDYVAVKWVMGHSLGQDDVYAFRDVEETADTMRKVEAYVFGSPKPKTLNHQRKPRTRQKPGRGDRASVGPAVSGHSS